MTGFLTGVAVNIVAGQLGDLTGASVSGPYALAKAVDLITNPTLVDMASLLTGLAALAPNLDGSRSDANRDFVAQGAGNLASGLFKGMPVGGSVGQTAINVAAGARNRWGWASPCRCCSSSTRKPSTSRSSSWSARRPAGGRRSRRRRGCATGRPWSSTCTAACSTPGRARCRPACRWPPGWSSRSSCCACGGGRRWGRRSSSSSPATPRSWRRGVGGSTSAGSTRRSSSGCTAAAGWRSTARSACSRPRARSVGRRRRPTRTPKPGWSAGHPTGVMTPRRPARALTHRRLVVPLPVAARLPPGLAASRPGGRASRCGPCSCPRRWPTPRSPGSRRSSGSTPRRRRWCSTPSSAARGTSWSGPMSATAALSATAVADVATGRERRSR